MNPVKTPVKKFCFEASQSASQSAYLQIADAAAAPSNIH